MDQNELKKMNFNRNFQEILDFFETTDWNSGIHPLDTIVFYGMALNGLKRYSEVEDFLKWLKMTYPEEKTQWYLEYLKSYKLGLVRDYDHSIEILNPFHICPFIEIRIKALLFLARIKSIRGDVDEASAIIEQLIQDFGANMDQFDNSKAYSYLGTTYYKQGHLKKALSSYEKCLSLLPPNSKSRIKLSTLTNICLIYEEMGDFLTAQNGYYEAKKLAEELKDFGTIAISLMNIGNIYLEQGELMKAKINFENAYKNAIIADILIFQANALCHLGNIEIILGNYEEASNILLLAKEINEPLGTLSTQMEILFHIALLYAKQGKKEEVIYILRDILKTMKNKNIVHKIGHYFYFLINFLIINQDYPQAKEILKNMKFYKKKYNLFHLNILFYLSKAQMQFAENNFGLSMRILDIFLQNAKDKKLIHHQIQAYLLLTKIHLTIALWNTDKETSVNNAFQSILRAKEIALNSHNPADLIEIINSHCSLEIIKGNFEQGLNILEEGLEIAKKMEMVHYISWIDNNIEEIKSRAILNTNPNYTVRKQGVEQALLSISYAINHRDPTLNDLHFNLINLLMYNLTKLGPDLSFSEKFIDKADALSAGIYLITALSKSTRIGEYNTGFYGPLPFLDHEALILTDMIKDSKSPDSRLDNQNYLMIVLVIPPNSQNMDRNLIKSILTTNLKDISTLQDLTSEFLKNLTQKLRKLEC